MTYTSVLRVIWLCKIQIESLSRSMVNLEDDEAAAVADEIDALQEILDLCES